MNEEQTPRIYRKAKGQIVIEGKVNLTDLEETQLNMETDSPFVVVTNPKKCLFVMVHTKFRTPFFQIRFR